MQKTAKSGSNFSAKQHADSELLLGELREAVQAASARLSLTLLRKGDRIAAGSPDKVMRQLNEGRNFAASVPAWEPPLTGDGEMGWGLGGDGPELDRQCALRLLRHPSLLDDAQRVHEKVRDAMRAPDLRPADLGKCARLLWWQISMEMISDDKLIGQAVWAKYCERWDDICVGHSWASEFGRRGYDILFAIEGLDKLMDSDPWMERGQSRQRVDEHHQALCKLATQVIQNDFFTGIESRENSEHISRRIQLVQWKARRRIPGSRIAGMVAAPQYNDELSLVIWFCHAATLLQCFAPEPNENHPIQSLAGSPLQRPWQKNTVTATVRNWVMPSTNNNVAFNTHAEDSEARSLALDFLIALTPIACRWEVLQKYPNLLGDSVKQQLTVLPSLPSAQRMIAFATNQVGMEPESIQLYTFTHSTLIQPQRAFIGAKVQGGLVDAVLPLEPEWHDEKALNDQLIRRESVLLPLTMANVAPGKARFAAMLFEALYVIQQQPAEEGKEHVPVIAHLAHTHSQINGSSTIEGQSWYLLSEAINSEQLGVTAWIRDGQGRLRSRNVPHAYAHLWRIGWAVTDLLGLIDDEDCSDTDDYPQEETAIEDFVVRQQLRKLRGKWISDAQVQRLGRDGMPITIRRALDILRRFDSGLSPEEQAKLVMTTEAETQSMALRLQQNVAGDLRACLHLVPDLMLQRLPLSVLELLALRQEVGDFALRADIALLSALARSVDDGHPVPKVDALGAREALQIGLALACTGVALRGAVASLWGLSRSQGLRRLPERFLTPPKWDAPDAERQDPQRDYAAMRTWLLEDQWVKLNEATPWQWMLALLGLLDDLWPQAFEDINLHKVYECLRTWQFAPPDDAAWAWPYDGLPTHVPSTWKELLQAATDAAKSIDVMLRLVVQTVEASAYRRHPLEDSFTDASGQQWVLQKLQYTGLGSSESVARVQRGAKRLVTWTEVRRQADGELLSVHRVDDKLGRWLNSAVTVSNEVPASTEQIKVAANEADRTIDTDTSALDPISDIGEASYDRQINSPQASINSRIHGNQGGEAPSNSPDIENENAELKITAPESVDSSDLGAYLDTEQPDDDRNNAEELRNSQKASWEERALIKSESHMRVALFQWRIDETYGHPLCEVGLAGMGLQAWALEALRSQLNSDGSMAKASRAATRGKENNWQETCSVPSWPEHRRRKLLKRALDACSSMKVDLLVLPEVSVRPETIQWLSDELYHHRGLAVLAGTYRVLNPTDPEKHLRAPLTLLWRPGDEWAKKVLPVGGSRTLHFVRGKKYRAVAAKEFFRPDWDELRPLFTPERLLEQLEVNGGADEVQIKGLLLAMADDLPHLRYCMELICSELFLMTSPANLPPLQREVAALLKRFPAVNSAEAKEMVRGDYHHLGDLLSVAHSPSSPRRSVLLVPAATSRSSDYWYAGQASVLASGTATVFCNAVLSRVFCGGSCFIGMESTSPDKSSVGIIGPLTPYHGWRKGIFLGRPTDALSPSDQALVIADIDPVHVVSGKPRPQLLPEPMALVAYLPVVELLNSKANGSALAKTLKDQFKLGQSKFLEGVHKETTSKVIERKEFWNAFERLRERFVSSKNIDSSELATFADLFSDPAAVSSRLLCWQKDRHQQPHPGHGKSQLEPAWLDFIAVDLTVEGIEIATIEVPPWCNEAEAEVDDCCFALKFDPLLAVFCTVN